MEINRHQKVIIWIGLSALLLSWLFPSQHSEPTGSLANSNYDWGIIFSWALLLIIASWFVYLLKKPSKLMILVFVIFVLIYLFRVSTGPLVF